MKRRKFLHEISAQALAAASAVAALRDGARFAAAVERPAEWIDAATAKDWQARWEKSILGYSAKKRYCDTEMSEGLGWRVSPFINGYYYGYLVTHDSKWVERFVDWTDSCIKRAVKEPDGFLGWPELMDESLGFNQDSMLGEAMLLRPIVSMADEILKTPALKTQWGGKAESYLELAERTFEKWDSRDAWRDSQVGGLWVVQYFGIDPKTNMWTEGYARRKTEAFSHPDNKEHQIARWLITLFDVTKKPIYQVRAEKWWQLMKSRMKTREDRKFFVWDYWDPAGPWDYKPDGTTKHWVGVHPNGGYYADDLEGIVAAFQHQLVFSRQDIDRLIATNRDYMWNQQIQGANFQRIDGGTPDPRWPNSPGVLWDALIPYDETLRKIFVANHNPAENWGGLSATPWFLSLARQH
ncbi:MAG: hypothetical protein ABSF71_30010 [Terriglobia bacterium]|jgi:hypothetical protein